MIRPGVAKPEREIETHQKSREACEVRDHNVGSAVQCDLHKIFAVGKYAKKQASALNGALDEAQNEVNSEAEDDI